MRRKIITPETAKRRLIAHYKYFPSDFYKEDNEIYVISQGDFMEKATDIYENLVLQFKESLEENDRRAKRV